MKKLLWLERQFDFGKPEGMFPFYVERLSGTPARFEEKTKGCSDELLSERLDGKWSVKENIAHLMEVGRVSDRRIEEIRTGAAQMSSAMFPLTRDYNDVPIAELLKEFRSARVHSIRQYKNAPSGELLKTSVHPRLKLTMSIVDLAWFDAEHDDYHGLRISEILSILNKN